MIYYCFVGIGVQRKVTHATTQVETKHSEPLADQ